MNPADPNELVLLIIKIAFLVLLWMFVYFAVRAVRQDVFDPARRQQRRAATGERPPARPPRPVPRPPRPVDQQPPLPSKLVITKGPKAGATFPLTGATITIGRAHDSTLVLDEDVASARHARLFHHNGQWFIEDLESTNGTYLDRTKVTSPMPVPIGAPVRIGQTVLELHR